MTVALNAISIVVADMGRALAFYRLLGLDIPAGSDTEPHVEAAGPGGFRVLWDTEDVARAIDPDWQRTTGTAMSLAFQAGSPAEVDKLYAQLVDAGYHGDKPPWDAFWGQRYAVIHDPDGNSVDLFAAL